MNEGSVLIEVHFNDIDLGFLPSAAFESFFECALKNFRRNNFQDFLNLFF